MMAGFYAIMDARHEPKGVTKSEIKRVEIRSLRREVRKLEGYERLSPNSEYSLSRQAEIAALKDEIKDLSN